MISNIFGSNTVAMSIALISACIALGLGAGQIRWKGIGLGVSGVLFSGLFLGHLGCSIDAGVLAFVRNFGLILFIFAVGLQVGPGFTEAFRSKGLLLNGLASGVTLVEAALCVIALWLTQQPAAALVGVFSGAVTSTPALAAASQTLSEILTTGVPEQLTNLSLGYAVAYPFGVLGVIMAIICLRAIWRIDIPSEVQRLEDANRRDHPVMHTRNLKVTNPNLFGKPLSSLPGLEDMGVTISRVMVGQNVRLATPDTELQQDMIVHAVGDQAHLDRAELIIGPRVETELQASHGKLEIRYLLVTSNKAIGRTLQQLHLLPEDGVTVTRIRRAGVELAPRRYLTLHFGDKVVCVGQSLHMARAEKILGNSSQMFNKPNVLAIFVGIAIGIVVGCIPIAIPGMSQGFRLGLSGGPLLAAIVLSRIQHFAGVTWYLPNSASTLLREMGLALFLACVGLEAGSGFVEAVLSDAGLVWMGIGAIITLVPLLLVGWLGRAVFRLNFVTLCGLIVGSMTSAPTLSFAVNLLKSDVPSTVYATVYPLATILRLLAAQGLVMLFLA